MFSNCPEDVGAAVGEPTLGAAAAGAPESPRLFVSSSYAEGRYATD
jgi:hypothetical protein